MQLNKKKCGIMQLAGRGNLSLEEVREESLFDIPFVEHYKYLGIEISKNLKINI
jgi:hypothetical protein